MGIDSLFWSPGVTAALVTSGVVLVGALITGLGRKREHELRVLQTIVSELRAEVKRLAQRVEILQRSQDELSKKYQVSKTYILSLRRHIVLCRTELDRLGGGKTLQMPDLPRSIQADLEEFGEIK